MAPRGVHGVVEWCLQCGSIVESRMGGSTCRENWSVSMAAAHELNLVMAMGGPVPV